MTKTEPPASLELSELKHGAKVEENEDKMKRDVVWRTPI